jgi:hypothetical protein
VSKKGTAAAILALMPSKKGKDSEEYDEGSDAEDGDEGGAKAAAGEALADAIKSGDGAAIAAAFEDLKDCCS